MNSIPEDVLRLFGAYFLTREVVKMRRTSKSIRIMCQSHSPENTYPIAGRLKYWKLFDHINKKLQNKQMFLICYVYISTFQVYFL